MKVKVRDVQPNPYRNIEDYPLNKEKIMALTKSIEKTGFWDNLVGREIDGKIQIAYGHHRIEALRLAQGFGYDFEFDLPIKEIDNGTMIQIMANENMQEWEHSMGVTDETVKVAKEYLESDDLFMSGKNKSKGREDWKNKASANDIADFLAWNLTKVSSSLKRMNLIESGVLDKTAVLSLPSETHGEEFTKAIKGKDFTPKEQQKIVEQINTGGHGKRDVKAIVEKVAFEKKYGEDFGKKKKEVVDKKLQEFDLQLGYIAHDISSLSDKFVKLTGLKNEMQSITSQKGLFNLKILFMAFGNLEIKMQRFKNAMIENTEDITEEYINEVKQLNQ